MRYFLFKSAQHNFFLLALSNPQAENAVVDVLRVTDLEWADGQPTGVEILVLDAQLPQVADEVKYLRVDAWPKYYFPTFFPSSPGQDYTYQWYELADAQELLYLVQQCLHVAATAGGVTVGSR